MDNQEAEIKVAQEVPFITGQYTSTDAGTDQRIPSRPSSARKSARSSRSRRRSTTAIAVLLKIEQESSSIALEAAGTASDLITNKRTITTNVLIEDGGIVVLGGLIQDNVDRAASSACRCLGRIPLIGELFKHAQHLKHEDQPDGLHPPEDPARRRAGGDRDRRQVQLHARPAAARATARRRLLPLLPGEKPTPLPPLPPARMRAPSSATTAPRPAAMPAAPPAKADAGAGRQRHRPGRAAVNAVVAPAGSGTRDCRSPSRAPRRAGARCRRRRAPTACAAPRVAPLAIAEVRRFLGVPLQLERGRRSDSTSCCAGPTRAAARRCRWWRASRTTPTSRTWPRTCPSRPTCSRATTTRRSSG